MFKRPIAPSLSPNTQIDDIWYAICIIFKPLKYKRGKSVKDVEDWFKKTYQSSFVCLFNSGRSSFYAILKAFEIGEGDEVIIQAYTCVAVPDPILWCGAVPVYVDVDNSFNIDVRYLEKRITPKTKAIVVQHTFGLSANLDALIKIAHMRNIVVIEDCSHALGVTYKGKKVGSFGDAAFFSFGRDKVVSSVSGGAAIIHFKHTSQGEELKQIEQNCPFPSLYWIFQQVFHPVAFSIILPLYNLQIGKAILYLLLKLHLLSKPVEKKELIGQKPGIYPQRYPNALAALLVHQLKKLDYYNMKRRKIALLYIAKLKKYFNFILPHYDQDNIYLRFTILTKHSHDIIKKAKVKGMLLGNWYRNIIDPDGVDFEKIYYKKGSCPFAEKYANDTVNLPTYPALSDKDINEVIELFQSYGNQRNY